MKPIRVAVIGGGPGGLVTLKTLLEASTAERPIEAHLFEKEEEIGGTFKYRSYENAELVSSKQLTAFSDYRFPPQIPDHISLPDYVKYLNSYVKAFRLSSHLSLGCRVTSIVPLDQDTNDYVHRVQYLPPRGTGPQNGDGSQGHYYDCTHLAICTGLHVQPNIPSIEGIKYLRGSSIHSSQYKARSQLTGHDVLILGCGETAMDIAYEAIKAQAKSVTMCFRTGFLSFPKVLNRFRVFGKTFGGNLPIDGLITNLFETAYVHHKVRETRLRSQTSDIVIKKVMWFLTGTQEGCNQHVGALPSEMLGRSYVFLNKSHKAMPYLNRPYKEKQLLLGMMGNEYMDPSEDAQSPQIVDTCSFPSHFEPSGRVSFQAAPARKDWRRLQSHDVRPSLVVFCTGYKQDFEWLDPCYPTAAQADVRNIVKSDRPDVAFIGFVRPGVGAIPPIAEQQAMWWTALLTDRMALPTNAGHYQLLTKTNARIAYGVDYSTYMSILARDFGGAPSLIQLWQVHGWQVLFAYSLGASFVTFYRLVGPFAFASASDIATEELMDTIKRRGIVGNFFFGVIPMLLYGMVNMMAYMLEILRLLAPEQPTTNIDKQGTQVQHPKIDTSDCKSQPVNT